MSEPWFNPAVYAWIPGTALGVLGGVLGTLGGVLAPQGKAKGLVLGLWYASMVACAGLLVAGIVALVQKQPYGIWYGLGFPGLLGLFLLATLLPVMKLRYRQAEERKLSAQDVR